MATTKTFFVVVVVVVRAGTTLGSHEPWRRPVEVTDMAAVPSS